MRPWSGKRVDHVPSALVHRLAALVETRERWPRGRLPGDRDLPSELRPLSGVIASFFRAVVNKGVLLLGLVGEAGGSAQFATEPHLDVVIGADRDIRFIQIAAKNDVQQIRHGSFSRIRSTHLAATVGSIRDPGGGSVASDVGLVQTGQAGIQASPEG
jgi:hypothetical protein